MPLLFRGTFISIVCIVYTQSLLVSQQENRTIIIIDQGGNDTIQCCSVSVPEHKNCACSNLTLALQKMESNTEIYINSNIKITVPLYAITQPVISNVSITGNDSVHPIVMCDSQKGGIYIDNVNNISIKGITWDQCEIQLIKCMNAMIRNCLFQHSVLREYSVVINNSSALIEFSTFIGNRGDLRFHLSSSVTIHGCSFTSNGQNNEWTKHKTSISSDVSPGHAIYCYSSKRNLILQSSNFSNYINSAVILIDCHFNMTGRITFKNNTAGIYSPSGKPRLSGAAIHSQSSLINITVDTILFVNNRAANSGGAIFLTTNSTMGFHQGNITFNNNSASKGDAIYTNRNSCLIDNNVTIKLQNTTPAPDNGAIYIDDVTNINKTIPHYYNSLGKLKLSNGSHIPNFIYFAINNTQCQPNKTFSVLKKSYLFASSPCSIVEDFDNAAVKVDKSNYNRSHGNVLFWLHDLKLNLAIVDYFGRHLKFNPCYTDYNNGLLLCNSTQCSGCKGQNYTQQFTYSIVKFNSDNVIVALNNSNMNNTVCCCLNSVGGNSVVTLTTPYNTLTINATVVWNIPWNQCDGDIGHFILNSECLTTSCDNLLQAPSFPPGLACPNGYVTATPSYWYNNSFTYYITSCPVDNCDLAHWYEKILPDPFPDQNLQCKHKWRGFACGECHDDIKYDTTKCVSSNHCLKMKLTESLLVLFGVSLVYWVVVISFIFVLLHFRFNIKAGYAYGIIFYYSVLHHIVVVFNEIVQTENCGFSNDEHYYQCVSVQTSHEFLKQHLLPFLSAFGILKPPFMQYMRLCPKHLEMIDHIFLSYIHPFIVIPMVIILFISTRRYVIVARAIGRFINSTTICILILLSYSSVSYTSLQLLRPLPYYEFKPSAQGGGIIHGWKSYWSPAKSYFEGRHKFYVIVAVLCELVIGIGLPVFLLLQRYLMCHLNFNFNCIRLILDQLQGCYKKQCYWFAAYYMICRQVLYLVDVLIVFEGYLWMDHISVKLVIMLIISVIILVVHLWFQPYNATEELRTQNLNLLDSAILVTLVMLLICSLDGRSYGVTVVFWILPLLFLLNYLTYLTKLKHVFALCSICGVIIIACLLVFLPKMSRFYYLNLVSILFFLASVCTLVFYIIVMVKKCVRARYHHHEDAQGNDAQNIDVSVESDK